MAADTTTPDAASLLGPKSETPPFSDPPLSCMGPPYPALACPACRCPWNEFSLGGLAASDGVGWERKRKEPSKMALQRQIVILRRTRNCTVARYSRLRAILLTPKPLDPSTLKP